MTDQRVQAPSSSGARPSGFVQPAGESAHRALKALEECRLHDAERHLAAMSETNLVERAWRSFLRGRLALERAQMGPAKDLFLEAAATASQALDDPQASTDLARLSAWALDSAGLALRRLDRPSEGYGFQMQAYRLREQHGSNEELWETLIHLGLNKDLQRDFDEAVRWFREAMELSAAPAFGDRRRYATACGHLAASVLRAGRLGEAVETARAAAAAWQAVAPGELESVLAQMHLGHALLRLAQSEATAGGPPPAALLSEALDQLISARENLLPFGARAASDARWCAEQIDFTQRLRESLTRVHPVLGGMPAS